MEQHYHQPTLQCNWPAPLDHIHFKCHHHPKSYLSPGNRHTSTLSQKHTPDHNARILSHPFRCIFYRPKHEEDQEETFGERQNQMPMDSIPQINHHPQTHHHYLLYKLTGHRPTQLAQCLQPCGTPHREQTNGLGVSRSTRVNFIEMPSCVFQPDFETQVLVALHHATGHVGSNRLLSEVH